MKYVVSIIKFSKVIGLSSREAPLFSILITVEQMPEGASKTCLTFQIFIILVSGLKKIAIRFMNVISRPD